MRKLMLLLVLVVMTSGCAVRQQINQEYAAPGGATSVNAAFFPVSVLVTDDRPYVVSGDKEDCYIGIYKAGFGIPYDVRTNGEKPLAGELKRDLETDLRGVGFAVSDSGPERIIAVSIQDYNFNCYINCRVWNTLHVQIKDGSGKVLRSKVVSAERVVEGSAMWGPKAAMERELPKIYAQMIQNIVRNDPEVMAVLRRAE